MKETLRMKVILRNHGSIFLFSLVIVVLWLGVLAKTGLVHTDKMALFSVSLLVSYFLFYYLSTRKGLQSKLGQITPITLGHKWGEIALFLVPIFLFVVDMVFLNGPPVFKAFVMDTMEEVAILRSEIHADSPTVIVYLSGFNIRAILPFAILYFLLKKKYFFYSILLALACLYGFALMQKSFIISILLPAFIVSIFSKRYIFALKHIALIGLVILSLLLITNKTGKSEISEEPVQIEKTEPQAPLPLRLMVGISNRIFFVPGEIVSNWFDIIPSEKPFLNGNGYPIIAKIKGEKFVNYNKVLYPIMRPNYVAKGLTGTVNAATFVREYSNFGYVGLLLSGIMVSLVFVVIQLIFKSDVTLFYAINSAPILLIGSTSILTLLFSGGWFLMILMYFLYLKPFKQIR